MGQYDQLGRAKACIATVLRVANFMLTNLQVLNVAFCPYVITSPISRSWISHWERKA